MKKKERRENEKYRKREKKKHREKERERWNEKLGKEGKRAKDIEKEK